MWVKLSDDTPNDPDIWDLGDGAFRLWFNALCYCAHHLTDGFVPQKIINKLAPFYRSRHLHELIESGLAIKVEGGIKIRNYTKYNPTREDYETAKKNTAERVARWRERQASSHAPGPETSHGLATNSPRISHGLATEKPHATPIAEVIPLVNRQMA